MNDFVYKNNRFIYVSGSGDKILLDCNDFLQNKSRVPFHAQNEDDPTISKMIFKLLREHPAICEGTGQQEFGSYYALVDTMVTAYHVKSSAPKRILELGCLNGVMSCHLASVLSRLHPQSLLYSVSNTISGEIVVQWLDHITQVKELPQVAFAATDYESTGLQSESFDIVVINGSVPIDYPDKTIIEALRLTKPGGRVICFAMEQPLLESGFQLICPEREEYFFSHHGRVLVADR